VGYLAVTGGLAGITALQPAQWGWVLLTGLFLGGYVATWFGALQRAPASLVTAILVLGAPATAGIQALWTGKVPAEPVLVGQALVLLAGAALVLVTLRRRVLAVLPAAA
jgi:drug/metabolite transporter (DMT)-like permease